QPEKAGWIRKFCGRGIFRELWRNRYVVLRGDTLYISDKEVKDERKAQEVFDLADYERSEELRKAKSRSKKNHSRFTLLRCRQPGNTVPNLVFLAVSPEEKESWVNALNVAIIKAKNRILDEVTIEEDGALVHPTRDRAKIPHGRRLPTRGHLMAVASTSSHGMLTLDLVAEEDGLSPDYDGELQESSWEKLQADLLRGVRQRAGTDVSKLRATSKEPKVKTSSLPRGSELSWGQQSHLEASKAQVGNPKHLKCPYSAYFQLQSLIAQRMQRAQELLEEMRLQSPGSPRLRGKDSPRLRGRESPRSKAKRNRSKGTDSPRSRGSQSPAAKANDSPRLKDSPRTKTTDPRSPKLKGSRSASCPNEDDDSAAQKSPKSAASGEGFDTSPVKEADSQQESETDSPRPNQKNSPSISGSFEPSQPKTPDKHLPPASPPALLSESELRRRHDEAERLLEEAVSSWKEAQEVLQEVKELQSQTLRRQRRRTYEKMSLTAAAAGFAQGDHGGRYGRHAELADIPRRRVRDALTMGIFFLTTIP
uniref:Pleckstrin homology domain containing, family O member 1a n=1 Tax=Sander lucioperca TaxID=283035 RepID=A0A8C9XR16_SANLU